jgi:hypothetical protein
VVIVIVLLALCLLLLARRRASTRADPERKAPGLAPTFADTATTIILRAPSGQAPKARPIPNPAFNASTADTGAAADTAGAAAETASAPFTGHPTRGQPPPPLHPEAETKLDGHRYVVNNAAQPQAPLPEYDTVDPAYNAAQLESTDYVTVASKVDYATSAPAQPPHSTAYELQFHPGELTGPPGRPASDQFYAPNAHRGSTGDGSGAAHSGGAHPIVSVEYNESGDQTRTPRGSNEYVQQPNPRRSDYEYAASGSSSTDPQAFPSVHGSTPVAGTDPGPEGGNFYAPATAVEVSAYEVARPLSVGNVYQAENTDGRPPDRFIAVDDV